MLKKILLNIFVLSILTSSVFAGNGDHIEVGIDEQLGSTIPLNVHFKDAEGKDVVLKDLFDRTTVLAFVYYNCPGICTPLMFALTDVISKSDLQLGADYRVITISMDQFETPGIAYKKKKDFMLALGKNPNTQDWKFLTGDSASIKTISDAAGFYFKREGNQFRHSGAFIFLNKNGKICRYLLPGYTDKAGFSILPFDFKMAVLEADEGKVTPTIAKILQFCFSYDPAGEKYVLNVTRIFGAGIIFLAIVFLIVMKVKPKKEFTKAR